MSDIIYTFPHIKTAGWDGTDSPNGLTSSTSMGLYPEFFNPQATDVMAVAYSVPGSTKFPRLNVGALAHMPDNYRPVLNWVFFDVDNPGHAKWSSPAEAEEHLDALPWDLDCLKNSGYYSTPGGYRLFWKLDTPIPVTRANGFLKAWGEHVSKQTGIVVDPASYEWTRFFRVPRANRPDYGVLPEPAFDTPRGTLDAYATGMVPDTDEVPEHRDQGDCPDEPLTLTIDQLTLCHLRAVRLGDPLPPNEQGSTYPALVSQMAAVAGNGSITDAHLLMSLFWTTVERTPGRTMAEAWKLAVHITNKEAAKQKSLAASASKSPLLSLMDPATQEEWRAIESAFPTQRKREVFDKLQAGAPLSRKEGKEAQAQIVGAARSIMGASPDIAPQTVFKYVAPSMKAQKVDADLVWGIINDEYQAARRVEVDKAEVYADDNPLVLFSEKDTAAFIHYPAERLYRRAGSKMMIPNYRQHTATGLEALGIEAPHWERSNTDDFLTKYGRQYRSMVHVSGQDGARFDKGTETLTEGVHELHPRLVPAFHKEVDIWLRKLGGQDAEALLDWLAVAPNVRADALPALYIDGPKGAGKSMLIQGLAMIFRSGNAVDYGSVGADFNEDLVKCPIISADEGIEVDPRAKKAASRVFRNLTGNNRHKIRRKGLAESDLVGYLRVLITCNGPHGVDFGVGVGAEGMDAINERIIYLRVEQEASQYLIDLGGRAGTRDWVDINGHTPGKVAQHIYHLYQTREVGKYPGGRFRVVGRVTEWHDNLKRSSSAVQEILRSVCECMQAVHNGRPGDKFDAGIKDNTLWVSKAALNYARSEFGLKEKKSVTKHMLGQLTGVTKARDGCRIGAPRPEKDSRSGKSRTRRAPKQAWPVPLEELIKTEYITHEELDDMRATFFVGMKDSNK